MSMKKVCDACGKELEHRWEPGSGELKLRMFTGDYFGSTEKYFDLCPECVKEIQRFIFSLEVHDDEH